MANPFRSLRDELGWTQQELADYVGIHRVRWAQLEGQAKPSIETAQAVMDLANQYGKELKLEDFFPRSHQSS